ncbi:TetR/AcrR family transcriptional regulator [Caulobacter mirabilis]|uniref:TetR family transcriptional regulator n=1 Tax=Caulobacter mirabilis TaxID=69666 RepID=A0A2D2AUP4_9CAUL|nr:TetR/AcrR family transcriptional regulator [Caulobacter mirabilis]ATQ41683.1 TetR family transcriptional regulator [Caulobacter mirabilis]
MRTADQAKREAKRAFILEAAQARFAESGFHATGMAEICAAVEMSPGTLYRYFKGKDEIVRAIIERDRQELVALASGVGRGEDVVASVVRLAGETLRRAAEPGYARIAAEILAEAGRDPAIGALYRRTDAEILDALETALATAARRGQVRADLDARMAALWLTALADGAVARFAFDPAADPETLLPPLEQMIRGFLKAG